MPSRSQTLSPLHPDSYSSSLAVSCPGPLRRRLSRQSGKEGLQVQQRDEGLVVFPSILRVLAADRAARINRSKVPGIRPSRLARLLKAIQARKPKAPAEHFLEVLHRAYRLLAGGDYGKTVTLSSIYDTLTLLPGSSATYDQTDLCAICFS